MDEFEALRETARKKVQMADHTLTRIFPSVKDPSLLVASLEHLFLALSSSLGALLAYERLFKRIPPFQDSFSSKFSNASFNLDNICLTKLSSISLCLASKIFLCDVFSLFSSE